MFYYKLGDQVTPEVLDKLKVIVPQQAFAIMLSAHEIAGNSAEVSEKQIIEHISTPENMERLNKGSKKGAEAVPGFVSYYRQMLKRLAENAPHILTYRQDDEGHKGRLGREAAPDFIPDPITGGNLANVFKRGPKKKGQGKKANRPVEADDDEAMPELKDSEAQAAIN